MANVNYEYYRIFYYVCQYRNFTQAARLLGSNQPNVTRSINRLEEQLGCRLFLRSNRGVTLTPEGETLLRHVEIAQEQLQLAEEALVSSAGLEHGSVTIGVSEIALNLFLLPRLRDFHRRYPGIRLHLLNHSTPQAIGALAHGTVDLAVVTTPTHGDSTLQETLLDPFQEILVGGRDFAFLAQAPHDLKELTAYPLICLGRDTTTFSFYRALFFSRGLELRPDTEAATTDQILPLVKAGLGLAFLPRAFAREALLGGEVVEIPLKEAIPPRRVSLLHSKRRPLSLAARALKALLCGEPTKEKEALL